MSAVRRGISPRIPFDGIKTGRPVSGFHPLALARACNELALAGGTVFFNPCHHTLTAVGGTITSGTFRHKVPLRRFGQRRLWVVCYSTAGTTIGGRISLNPDGLGSLGNRHVEPTTTRRSPNAPAWWIQTIDTSAYAPTVSREITYTISWDLVTSGGASIVIRSVACYELDRVRADSSDYAIDEGVLLPRGPIYSRTSGTGAAQGVRQLDAIASRLKTEAPRGWLWGHAKPGGTNLMSSASHLFNEPYDCRPRIHPARTGRTDPGFSYVPVTIWAYGKNSAVDTGEIKVTTDQGDSVTLTGFPIGSFGWVSGDVDAYCESTSNGQASGLLKGAAAGDDYPAETADRESAWEENLKIELRGKVAGEGSANTLSVESMDSVQSGAA